MSDETLYLFDWAEWFDVARKFMPGVTEEQFNEMWAEFQAEKAHKALS